MGVRSFKRLHYRIILVGAYTREPIFGRNFTSVGSKAYGIHSISLGQALAVFFVRKKSLKRVNFNSGKPNIS